MKKQDRFAVRTDLRFAVAENARTLRLELLTGHANVRYFVANVMNAAVGIALKEFCDRRVRSQRLAELDLGIWQRGKDPRNAGAELRGPWRQFGPQRVPGNPGCLGNMTDGDGNVIETTDHDFACSRSLIIPSRHGHGTSVSCPSARQRRRGPRHAALRPPRRGRVYGHAAVTQMFRSGPR